MFLFRTVKVITSAGLLGLYSSILLAGDIGVEGNVTATNFIGSGTGLTGVVKTEVDPEVGTLTADKWCRADATGVMINCDQDVPGTAGVYSVTGVAMAANQYADTPISFGLRFSTAPNVVTVGITDTLAQATAAGCPGTGEDPQADPGMLCLYEMARENTTFLPNAPLPDILEAGGTIARVSTYLPGNSEFGLATKFGAIVEIYSEAAGNFYSNGTWAATPP